MAAASAWGVGEWDSMDEFVQFIKSDYPDGSFFRTILHLHRNEFQMAEACIDQTREMLQSELAALVRKSYSRAYNVVVRVQMLTELEEIILLSCQQISLRGKSK